MKRFKLWLFLASLIGVLTLSCTDSENNSIFNTPAALSNDDAIKGLKEALRVGTDSTVLQLNKSGGYLNDQAIKILLPPEAQAVLGTLKDVVPGFDRLEGELIQKMNATAEDAAKEAGPIFQNAIVNMSVTDGLAIVKGADTSATHFLKQNTFTNLNGLYLPKVQNSMNKIGVQGAWKTIADVYNPTTIISGKPKLPNDISAYITDRALSGLFVVVARKEKDIRKNPLQQVTDILKKVFGRQN
jgi:hypothetical protein